MPDQVLDDILERAQAFADQRIRPAAARWECDRASAEDALRAASLAGFAGLLVPGAQGGLGLSVTTALRVLETFAAAHLPFAFGLAVQANLASALARVGTPAQRQRYLPKLLTGEAIGAFCLTEPSAGSDPAAIITRARPVASGWSVGGEKAWVTNGGYADLLSVYVQTDPAQGWHGIATLLIEASAAGVARQPPYVLLGGHAMATTGLMLTDVIVPADAVLAAPGQGFKAALAGIDLARVLLSGMCCGITQDSLAYAIAYAKERRAFGQPIADFQGLQWLLADVSAELAAARALALQAAAQLDAGVNATLMAAQAKKFAVQTARKGIGACMQALGALGLRVDNPVGRHFASAQIVEYLDGTTGIQNVVIARHLFETEVSPP